MRKITAAEDKKKDTERERENKSNEIRKKSGEDCLWDLPKMLAPTDEIKWLARINARAGSMSVILSWHFIMAVESIQSGRNLNKKEKRQKRIYKIKRKEPEKIRYLMTE